MARITSWLIFRISYKKNCILVSFAANTVSWFLSCQIKPLRMPILAFVMHPQAAFYIRFPVPSNNNPSIHFFVFPIIIRPDAHWYEICWVCFVVLFCFIFHIIQGKKIKKKEKRKKKVFFKRSVFQIVNTRCENKTEFSCTNFSILLNNRKCDFH